MKYKPLVRYAVVLAGLASIFTDARGQQSQPSAASLSNLDRRFYSALAEAASRTDLEKTKGAAVAAEVLSRK